MKKARHGMCVWRSTKTLAGLAPDAVTPRFEFVLIFMKANNKNKAKISKTGTGGYSKSLQATVAQG